MSSIRNRERTSLFPLLSIDLEKSRGRWKVLVCDVRVGKTYERKVQAIQAARRIRRAWLDSLDQTESSAFVLMRQLEKHFLVVADNVASDHPFG